ncbi:MAG TPA: DUF389 domain-containing protein [Anaerolineae bacterium]|nr:DUF389 domain-containing protein [Anaerolineae bacterium]
MRQDPDSSPYLVAVAVGSAEEMEALVKIGCDLAAARGGRLSVLSVTASGQKPDWLTVPDRCAASIDDGDISITVLAGRDAGTEILHAIHDQSPNLLLLGWRGRQGRGRYMLGKTLDQVFGQAPCDVAVVRLGEDGSVPHDGLHEARRILIPVGGGPNAGLALKLALTVAPEAQVTALGVARPSMGDLGLSLSRENLAMELSAWPGESRLQSRIVQAGTIVQGILDEADEGYEWVMLGASDESFLDRVLFGNVPQRVAASSPVPVLVVRRREGQVDVLLHRVGWRMVHLLPSLDRDQQIEVYKSIRSSARPSVDFYIMIALAAAIAAFGLLQNSAAVIIGAMLVAPLMAAIFGLSLGIVRGDLRLLKRAISAVLRGVLLAVLVGVAITVLTPAAMPQSEILARTRPSLLDLGVALASGAAGAYAVCRKEVSAALPGVAISAALVPPLATAGIGLALLQGEIAGGALLLFSTNLVAIVAAGGLVFLWLGFRPVPGQQSRARIFQRGVLGTGALLLAVTIPLGILTAQTVREAGLNRALDRAIRAEVAAMRGVELSGWEQLEDGGETVHLEVSVRSRRTVTHQEVVDLQERLAGEIQRPIALLLTVIPTTRLDPQTPPTPTPTPAGLDGD